jgi:Zn-finger nucleic acid-binding protein
LGRVVPVRAPSDSGELILDECPRGHGMWFDPGELAALLRSTLEPHAKSLDDIRAFLGEFASPAPAAEG